MRTRILKPEEWQRLEQTAPSPTLPYVAPENVAVVATEDDSGDIVGHLPVLRVTHLEGLWVKPERRNGVVLRPLLRQALAFAQVRGESFVLAGIAEDNEQMDGLIRRVGGRPLAAKFYVIGV